MPEFLLFLHIPFSYEIQASGFGSGNANGLIHDVMYDPGSLWGRNHKVGMYISRSDERRLLTERKKGKE
jgi:hypothetical protein